MKKLTALLFILFLIPTQDVYARITPDDIVKANKEVYEKKLKFYSVSNKQKLTKMEGLIAQVNKIRTDQLAQIMQKQAAILDEYQKRVGDKNAKDIDNTRYWITFAHEAVAFQAAKIYIFDLTSEKNLIQDVDSTINLLQSDLNLTRLKVINSQKTLKKSVKEQ